MIQFRRFGNFQNHIQPVSRGGNRHITAGKADGLSFFAFFLRGKRFGTQSGQQFFQFGQSFANGRRQQQAVRTVKHFVAAGGIKTERHLPFLTAKSHHGTAAGAVADKDGSTVSYLFLVYFGENRLNPGYFPLPVFRFRLFPAGAAAAGSAQRTGKTIGTCHYPLPESGNHRPAYFLPLPVSALRQLRTASQPLLFGAQPERPEPNRPS